MCAFQGQDQVTIAERVDQVDPRVVTEQLLGRLDHIGIQMDGIKETDIIVLVDQRPDGTEDFPERLPE
jgi:hypothetical protein